MRISMGCVRDVRVCVYGCACACTGARVRVRVRVCVYGCASQDLSGWGVASVRVCLMLLAAWNGLFFMERVVGNYHVNAYKAKMQQRQQQHERELQQPVGMLSPTSSTSGGYGHGQEDANGAHTMQSPPNVYESTDHFTSSLPFMGMRVSVSKDDLQELRKDGGGSQRRGREAYPTGETKKRL